MKHNNRLIVTLIATILLLTLGGIPTADAEFRLPGFRPGLQRLLSIMLTETESGMALSRRILGESNTLITQASADEVFRTLAHPENQLIAAEILSRLKPLATSPRLAVIEKIPQQTRWSEIDPTLRRWITEEMNFRLSFGLDFESNVIAFRRAGGASPAVFRISSAHHLNSLQEFRWESTVRKVAKAPTNRRAPVPGISANPFEQLCRWETQSNLRRPEAYETDQFVGIAVGYVKKSNAEILDTTLTPPEIRRLFVREDRVYTPQMPYNQEYRPSRAPFAQAPTVEIWPGKLSASRTVYFWDVESGLRFSFKGPTSHPHRLPTDPDPMKLDLTSDIAFGIRRTEEIARVDARLGPDPDFIILPEVLAVRDPKTGNGILVRDLRAMKEDHYYLPLFSLSDEILRISRVVPEALTEEYWLEHLVRPIARAKARFLIRYGIEFDSPHSQNILMEIDETFRPTGRLVFRDVSDTHLFEPYLEALEHLPPMRNYRRWEITQTRGKPNEAPQPHMDPRPQALFLYETDFSIATGQATVNWEVAHNWAYIEEVARLLGIPTPPSLEPLKRILQSNEGKAAIRRYHDQRGTP